MQTAKRLGKVQRIVEAALAHFPETRNDDRKLIYKIWTVFQGEHTINENTITKLLSHETIRRVRQKIQHNGKYPPTDPQVMQDRANSEDEYKKWALGAA